MNIESLARDDSSRGPSIVTPRRVPFSRCPTDVTKSLHDRSVARQIPDKGTGVMAIVRSSCYRALRGRTGLGELGEILKDIISSISG